jgi:L-ascorbate metabolism protein UlaG (beta-lactamase superfamily)
MFEFNNLLIQVDPTSREADYSQFPKADLVIITHHHGDHFDMGALQQVVKAQTLIVLTQKCLDNAEDLTGTLVMKNGDWQGVLGIGIQAVPAYNIVHMRSEGSPYHPRGEGNGYILTMGDKRIYVAGDTENIPEMKALKGINIAFLPMNLPYTMTPAMVADAVKSFKPSIVYPYHFGTTDTGELIRLLEGYTDSEIRIRDMQ